MAPQDKGKGVAPRVSGTSGKPGGEHHGRRSIQFPQLKARLPQGCWPENVLSLPTEPHDPL